MQSKQPEQLDNTGQPPRMSGADSFFLSIETDECPMNMAMLVIVEAGDDEIMLQRIRKVVTGDSPLLRMMRRKLRPAPLNLDHPLWIQNPEFNLDDHIVRHQLRTAIDNARLNRLVAKIVKTRLPRDKPMWEIHVIKGLPGDRTAFVLKMHHAYADGATGILLLQEIMDQGAVRNKQRISSRARDTASPVENSPPGQQPAEWLRLPRQLLVTLLADLGLQLHIFYQFLLKRRLRRKPPIVPHTRFNAPVSAKRSYAHGEFSMGQLREICSAFDCSRNEVFLAMISGALRNYLGERNELPERSLYAGLPLALLADEKRSQATNQLAFYRSSLATNIADPVQRLNHIKRRLARSTQRARNDWNRRLLERLTSVPPRAAQAIARLYRLLLKKRLLGPNFNVFTTLMPGPGRSASIGGRTITAIHPISIPYHGAGLFISAIRYRDQIQFGIIADQEQLPETEYLADLMLGAFHELLNLARGDTVAQPAGKAAAR